MAIGLLLVLAGLLLALLPAKGATERHSTTIVGPASAVAPTPRGEAARPRPHTAPTPAPPPARTRAHRGERSVSARPLSPRPPADRRDAPDPTVVHDVDRWALFSTQVGFLNVPVALSDDLREWAAPVDALPELPPWAEVGRTWAPGVLRRNNGFVLYFAARSRALVLQCIGAATARVVQGPYSSTAPEPLVCQPQLGGSIDPQPFVDSDGTAYLLWKADANAIGQISVIFAQPLRPDGLALAGEAVPLLRHDAPWERPLIENPALLAVDGAHILLYSGGWWESAGYATGYAVCDTPLGPCAKKTTTQPVLAGRGAQAGTGGASVVTGPAGDHWLVHHAWTADAIGYGAGGVRSIDFVSLRWDGKQLVVRLPG
jgi:beta-xylosidase